MDNNAIMSWIEQDIETGDPRRREFPVTTMSRALSTAIEFIVNSLNMPVHEMKAIDVGTGSGVHAFLLATLGFNSVYGLDRSVQAISYANERAARLKNECCNFNGNLPQFIHGCIETIANTTELPGQFDLMVMNPPAFYTLGPINIATPIDSGLFTGIHPTHTSNTDNPLNAFFDAVSQRLTLGGIAIATWPGVQTRQVTDGGDCDLHPAQILTRRFAWNIDQASSLAANDFYRYRSKMAYSYYSSNDFRSETHDFIRDGYYHPSVKTSDPDYQHHPTFPFGILALQRHTDNPSKFSLIDINLPT